MEIKNKTCWVLAGGLIHIQHNIYIYVYYIGVYFGYVHVYIALSLLL